MELPVYIINFDEDQNIIAINAELKNKMQTRCDIEEIITRKLKEVFPHITESDNKKHRLMIIGEYRIIMQITCVHDTVIFKNISSEMIGYINHSLLTHLTDTVQLTEMIVDEKHSINQKTYLKRLQMSNFNFTKCVNDITEYSCYLQRGIKYKKHTINIEEEIVSVIKNFNKKVKIILEVKPYQKIIVYDKKVFRSIIDHFLWYLFQEYSTTIYITIGEYDIQFSMPDTLLVGLPELFIYDLNKRLDINIVRMLLFLTDKKLDITRGIYVIRLN